MDLADIRKKANQTKATGKTSPVPRPAAVAPVAEELPGKKGLPISAPAPAVEASGSGSVAPGDDRLERLFAFTGDRDFASEESYLQGLTGVVREEEEFCQWLTFSLGSEEYALEINQVMEIIKPRPVTEIPRVPEFILGVISLRGIIVPVFDLRLRLRLGRGELTSASRIVVCRAGERSAGLLVDRISQVVRLPVRAIEPPPAVLSGLDRELVKGVGRQQNRMLIQLYLPNVLNPELT